MVSLVSVQEIAKRAKVSQSTVSKVLNGYSDISEKTKQNVLTIAKEMGYIPNAAAISLVKKHSTILGVIYEVRSGFSNLFFSAILESFRIAAETKGYTLMLLSQNPQNQSAYWMQCLSHKIDSVFIISTNDHSQVEKELQEHGISTLSLDPIGPSTHWISSDNFGGVRKALDYLYQTGHKRIAFVQGSLHSTIGKARKKAYEDFVKEMNLPDLVLHEVNNDRFTLEEGYQTAKQLLSRFDYIDAFACSSDVLALGVIYCLQDHQIRVPDDVSVMGFDDLRICDIVRPRLTTIRQDSEAIGKVACELLLETKSKKSSENSQFIPTTLVIRDSTKTK